VNTSDATAIDGHLAAVRDRSAPIEVVKTGSRNDALDFTKGALVLLMVLYHWLNYFVSSQGMFYRYLRFLTPSFILITGFLISNIYLSKYDTLDTKLAKRLIGRGLKLLVVFLILNLGIGLMLQRSTYIQGLPDTLRNLIIVFTSGNTSAGGQGKTASFFILVPIGYLLISSAVLIKASRGYKYTFDLAWGALVISVFVLRLAGLASANLEFLLIGLLGVLLGRVPIRRINAFVKKRMVPVLCSYACYVAAITVWDTLYPLQIIGVCLSVMLIYLLGLHESVLGMAGRVTVLLGKYSLFGYIVQIAILQLLRSGLSHMDVSSILVISCFAAFSLTLLSVEAVDRARLRLQLADRLYKAVFA
jgi:peptidoglycan/LPS O-acetylase OafA/YrhL